MKPRNKIIQGDALEVLRTLPDASVDCVVTSPPYFQVRSYQGGAQEFGQETHVDEWVTHLRAVAAEIARVLVPWGAFWLNVADVYASRPSEGAPAKSLLLGPERLAQALLADGWLVRNRLSWTKPNPLPSSAADRLTQSWEFVYLLVRERHYFFDLDAIREPLANTEAPRPRPTPDRRTCHGARDHGHSGLTRLGREGLRGHPLGKNPGDAWRKAAPGPGSRRELPHRADPAARSSPPARRRSVLVADSHGSAPAIPFGSWTANPGPRTLVPCGCGVGTRPGLVLDPFMGSGTVALVARRYGRDWLGIELNPEYVRLTRDRLERSA